MSPEYLEMKMKSLHDRMCTLFMAVGSEIDADFPGLNQKDAVMAAVKTVETMAGFVLEASNNLEQIIQKRGDAQ